MTTSAAATKQLATTLAPYLHPDDAILLIGDLGAGKTQFVQGVAEALGISADVTSPTFNIMVEYDGGALPLYHFDLYRLDDSSQLDDIGYFEVLESGGVSFIEWGDKFPDAMPYGYLEIAFRVEDDGARTIVAHSYGERARQLLFLWANDSKSRLMKTTR